MKLGLAAPEKMWQNPDRFGCNRLRANPYLKPPIPGDANMSNFIAGTTQDLYNWLLHQGVPEAAAVACGLYAGSTVFHEFVEHISEKVKNVARCNIPGVSDSVLCVDFDSDEPFTLFFRICFDAYGVASIICGDSLESVAPQKKT